MHVIRNLLVASLIAFVGARLVEVLISAWIHLSPDVVIAAGAFAILGYMVVLAISGYLIARSRHGLLQLVLALTVPWSAAVALPRLTWLGHAAVDLIQPFDVPSLLGAPLGVIFAYSRRRSVDAQESAHGSVD